MGICEFVRLAEQHGLPRAASVQNPQALMLMNRTTRNGLDEAPRRSGVSPPAESWLSFGTLAGKYDAAGFCADRPDRGRIARFANMRAQRRARRDNRGCNRF